MWAMFVLRQLIPRDIFSIVGMGLDLWNLPNIVSLDLLLLKALGQLDMVLRSYLHLRS